MYFPADHLTGIPRRRFYAEPPDFDRITDSWEYEDGSKDFNEVGGGAPLRWEYEFNLLSHDNTDPVSVAIFDAFNAAARRVNPFYFTDKYGDTYFPVFIEEYSRTHEAHRPWIQFVRFRLVGYNAQIVSVSAPTVSLESADLVGTDIEIVGTVSAASDLYLQVNDNFYQLINDNGSFTFTVPLSFLTLGVNTFHVIAVGSNGGFDVSNTLTYTINLVAAPFYSGAFTLGGKVFTLGGKAFTLGE